METVEVDTQWIKKFMLISEQEINSPSCIKSNDIDSRVRATCYDTDNEKILSEKENKFLEQRKRRMLRMQSLFASQPRLERICKDWKNNFVDSGFRAYHFPEIVNDSFKKNEDDLKYLINLCGPNLTNLDLYYYPLPEIMQLIKSHCPNLTSLVLRFKEVENCEDFDLLNVTSREIISQEVESNHFDNAFSNMSCLESLTIRWQYENSTLPMTLVKSIKQVQEALSTLYISCKLEKIPLIPSVLSLEIRTLVTIISEKDRIRSATIDLDYGFNQVFITITNNSQNIKSLRVRSSNITDKALIELNNLDQLESSRLGLIEANIENSFIMDQSIQCLFNNTIINFVMLKCIRVSDRSIIKDVKNLPNTKSPHVEKIQITIPDFNKISKLTVDRKLILSVNVNAQVYESVLEVNRSVKFHTLFTK